MVLKRVTLSGRFGHPREEDAYKTVIRGVLFLIIDAGVLFITGTALFFAFAGYMITPVLRPFHCNDTGITQPFYENTVSVRHLLYVSLLAPLGVILVAEALLFVASEGKHRLAKYFTSSTLTYMKYLLGYTLCTFAMEVLKCGVGRLRPHFLAACDPDWTRMDCTTDPNAVLSPEETFCRGTERRVRTARTSFPSGHTAAAVYFCLFSILYLARLASVCRLSSLIALRNVLLPILTLWTVFTAVTRMTDYWHHPTDVLGGAILAAACIFPCFWHHWTTYEDVYDKRAIEKARPKFE